MAVIGISQSNYLPWKGYFDLINDCDIFVFLDEVQYTKQDWRNRNLIKTMRGKEWITIPIGKNIKKKIYEVKPINNHWQRKHKKSIQMAYSSCKFYKEYEYAVISISCKNSSLSFYFVYKFLPETKGLKLEEVEQVFKDESELKYVANEVEMPSVDLASVDENVDEYGSM